MLFFNQNLILYARYTHKHFKLESIIPGLLSREGRVIVLYIVSHITRSYYLNHRLKPPLEIRKFNYSLSKTRTWNEFGSLITSIDITI